MQKFKGKSKEPGALLLKQAAALFSEAAKREAFVTALMDGDSREQAIIVLRDEPAIKTFPREWPTKWQPDFVTRLSNHFRPGKHPLYEKGAFYSLDFSSVFSASAMLAIPTPPQRVLDLCASPGGKSIFAWRAFQPGLMVCNETVRKRADTLIHNLQRCRVESASVWTTDPSVYAQRAAKSFDFIIVDAPCSGQSLMARNEPAPGAFTPHMIDMCVGRQHRILGNAIKCLSDGGHILYSTCTFSEKENERVLHWALREHDFLEAVEVPALKEFQSEYTELPCYRLFPQSGLGAGAFVALIRNKNEAPAELPELDLPTYWSYGQPIATKKALDIEGGSEQPDESTETAPQRTKAQIEQSRTNQRFRQARRRPTINVKKKPRRGRR